MHQDYRKQRVLRAFINAEDCLESAVYLETMGREPR